MCRKTWMPDARARRTYARAASRWALWSMAFHGMKYRTRLNFARWKAGWSNIEVCWSPIPTRTGVRASAAAGRRVSAAISAAQRRIAKRCIDPGTPRNRSGCGPPALVLRLLEVHHEDERLVRADRAARALRAVAEVRRDHQQPAAADLHPGDALVPALDDLPLAERERERLAAAPAR